MAGKPKSAHHGLSRTPEYKAWQQMRLRCTDPKHAAYARYGARGITVCPEWLDSPKAFIAHIGPRPSPRHELDREKNDRGYEPGNVRWVLRPVNDRNRRSNRRLTFQGENLTLIEWSERVGIPADTIKARLDSGWNIEETLTVQARAKLPNRARIAADKARRELREKSRKLPPGVKRKRGKFVARIRVGGKERSLGSFSTPEAAHAAYIKAKTKP